MYSKSLALRRKSWSRSFKLCSKTRCKFAKPSSVLCIDSLTECSEGCRGWAYHRRLPIMSDIREYGDRKRALVNWSAQDRLFTSTMFGKDRLMPMETRAGLLRLGWAESGRC